MSKAYSGDVRQRVIAQVEGGASRREAAEEFEISASTAIIWVKCFRETGRCAAKPRGGSISPLEKHSDFLLGLIEQQPDLTLDEVVLAMRKHKIPGSPTAVWRFFNGTHWTTNSGWDSEMVAYPFPSYLIRLSGRCPRGERLIGHVPQGHWKTALRRNGMRAPCTVDGSMSGSKFLAYVQQSLAPHAQTQEISS